MARSGSLANIALAGDRRRGANRMFWLETTLQDIRYGVRQLGRAPGLVATAVLSLALGIGANTAIFTLVDSLLLQSLPVRDPAHLVLFYDGIATGVYSGGDLQADEFSYPFYLYLKAHDDSFTALGTFRQSNDRAVLHVSGESSTGPGERSTVHLVSGNYFELLGVNAALGRLLGPADDSPSASRAAVLSYPFWRDRFHLDPAILGRRVVLNGAAFTVIGVAAREFFGERVQPPPDFWLPLSAEAQILKTPPYLTMDDVYWLNLIGRFKPGVTLANAQAAANLRFHQYYLEQAGAHLSSDSRRKIQNIQLHLKPGGAGISGLRFLYSRPLHVLMAVVAVVLLIACANVATLLLARASARRPEFLARLALGASRTRLVRQVLTESILLSFIGAAVGIGFAWWGIKLLLLLVHIHPVTKVRPDFLVLAFTLALSVATGLLFGIFPAWKFSRMDPRPGNAATPMLVGRLRIGSAQSLVALQIALALILLFGAGLLAHSLLALEHQNIGFERANILVVRTDTSLAGYKQNELFPLYRDIAGRLSHLPGVLAASIARFTPESGNRSSGNFSMEGYTPPSGLKLQIYDVPVAPGFFETLRIPLLAGRTIIDRDMPGSPDVAVVNQAFVNQYLPHENPIGRRIMLGAPFAMPGAEIVGVVADSKYYDLRDKAPPMIFFSLWQKPAFGIDAVLRTTAAPLTVAAEVRQALKQVNVRLPVLDTITLDTQIERTLAQQKMIATLSSFFGLLSLLLAAVGIYGTLAYSVAGRTSEIGVRMAIGAQRRNVLWLILGDSLAVVFAGLVLGLPLALGASHWLKSFLFGVQGLDPAAIVSAVALISLLALLASYLPARRAARIDPMCALRHE
jgi:predicted permease